MQTFLKKEQKIEMQEEEWRTNIFKYDRFDIFCFFGSPLPWGNNYCVDFQQL